MSIDFDGSTGYINCGNILDFAAGESFSVSTWTIFDGTGRQDFISKEGSGATGWNMQVYDSNNIQFGNFRTYATPNYPVVASSFTISIGVLYHIVGVYDADDSELRLYVDGVIDGTTDTAGDTGEANSENLNIGRRPNDDYYLNGSMEDVRVYDRALSAEEVQTMFYARGRDYICNGLVGRWMMTEFPDGTPITSGGGSGFSINNYQTTTSTSAGTSITLSYTIPSVSDAVLVVCAGAESSSGGPIAQPDTATFGATSMNKRAGENTTGGTFAAGASMFTLGVTGGSTETITVNYPGSTSAKILQAYVVGGASDSINTTTTGFNNSGNTTVGFTTSASDKLGITHHFTGNNDSTSSTAGTGHTEIGDVQGGGTGFSSRIGYFDASVAGAYSGYGFNTAATPNRSVMCMAALDLVVSSPGPTVVVPDQTINSYTGTPNGTGVYTNNIAVR